MRQGWVRIDLDGNLSLTKLGEQVRREKSTGYDALRFNDVFEALDRVLHGFSLDLCTYASVLLDRALVAKSGKERFFLDIDYLIPDVGDGRRFSSFDIEYRKKIVNRLNRDKVGLFSIYDMVFSTEFGENDSVVVRLGVASLFPYLFDTITLPSFSVRIEGEEVELIREGSYHIGRKEHGPNGGDPMYILNWLSDDEEIEEPEVIRATDPPIANELFVPEFGPEPEYEEVAQDEREIEEREVDPVVRLSMDIPHRLRYIENTTATNSVPAKTIFKGGQRYRSKIQIADIEHEIARIGTGQNTNGTPFYQAYCPECDWEGARRRVRFVSAYTTEEVEHLRAETNAFRDWIGHEWENHHERMADPEKYAKILIAHQHKLEDALKKLETEQSA